MKSLVYLVLLIISPQLIAGNWGHRASGGPGENLYFYPENSLIALKASLLGINNEKAIQYNKKYIYLEFDVRETFDNKLVIFHDSRLIRMIPYKGENKKIYKKLLTRKSLFKRIPFFRRFPTSLRIEDLTLAELQEFTLKGQGKQKIPTLKDFLEAAKKYKLIKPMAVELKYIRTYKSKKMFLELVSQFHFDYMLRTDIIKSNKFDMPFEIGIIAFKKNFKRSFAKNKKESDFWCSMIKQFGLHGVFKTGNHINLCKNF